jgi:tRNA A-37 threonylcarbamoyl transferase component Bud32
MLRPPNTANSSPYVPPADPIAPLRAALRGHYDIEREIGQGAFATVYLARDLKHERKVAVKVLKADPASEVGELRFIREIRTLARLQHPNILPLHDSGHVEALVYYVMPYVSGDTLRDRINREKQMSIEAACGIARDVADALGYAHAQGIVHRDIKPENILLSTGHPILADFGIARLIDLAGVRQLTRTGGASPGTPAYMSPEQLMGDKEVDGRSDTYSLGCVLFEMLTGKPPFAGKEGFVQRFTKPPLPPSTFRKDLPSWLDDAIERALQREPADRYPTAKEFVAALCGPESTRVQPAVRSEIAIDPRRSSWGSFAGRIRSHPKAAAGVLVGALATAIALGTVGRSGNLLAFSGGVALDTARFAVLPFTGPDPVGAQVAASLYDVFTEWRELPLVPDTRVAQAIREKGSPTTESEAMALGKALGAGKVIWGTASGSIGSARVRAHVYDVSSKESKDDIVFDDTKSNAANYSLVANRLLGARDRPSAAQGCDGGTRIFPAWSACVRGHVALKTWDMAGAEREFRTAIAADPEYASGHLWLAQIKAWTQPGLRGAWQDHAIRAASFGQRLSTRERLMAEALVAMGEQSYPVACDKYRKLTIADSVDFIGWYGLGDCQAFDSLVVPAASSPSRWYFRSSNRSAASAYRRALRQAPGARAVFRFERLQRLLPIAATKVRFGKSAPPERVVFFASPSLGANDTLAFVPYPSASFGDKPATAAATLSAALVQNTQQLLDFTIEWTRESPNDPTAFEALADVLDARGDIGDDPSPTASALSAIRRAGALSTDPNQKLRTVSKETWLRFKRAEFGEAKKLADDALAARSQPSQADAEVLTGLAALTGRVDRMARLAELTGAGLPPSIADVSGPVKSAASKLFALAALGVCGRDVAATRRELDDAIDRYVAPGAARATSQAILARPLSMLAPCTGGHSVLEIPPPRDRITRMQEAFARGDRTAFRAISDTIALRVRMRRPGDLSPDFTFQHAWLRAAFGDTSAAIAQLDRSLRALPGLSPSALHEAGSAAAILRAMILRADLAAKTGDLETARKWANSVALLWSNADTSLQPEVARMRVIARGRP